jgi:hypothetical protein
MLQDAAEPEGSRWLVGGALIAVAGLDLLLAFFFAFVRKPAEPRARVFLPLALLTGALVIAGLGVAFLVGAIGG